MVEENLSHGMCMLSLSGLRSQSVGGRARPGCSMEVNLTPLFGRPGSVYCPGPITMLLVQPLIATSPRGPFTFVRQHQLP